MLVSKEPDATKLPKGWKWRLQIFALWPGRLRRTGKMRGRAERRNRGKIFNSSFPPDTMQKCSHTIPTNILWKITLFCGNISDFTPAMQRNSDRKPMINELNDSPVLRYGNYRHNSKDLHSKNEAAGRQCIFPFVTQTAKWTRGGIVSTRKWSEVKQSWLPAAFT